MASSKASAPSRILASSSAAAAAEAAFRTANAAASILARSKPPDSSDSDLPAPDLLLRHLDRAIAAAEGAQASYLLSLSSSSPSFYASHLRPPSAFGLAAFKKKNGSEAGSFLEPEQFVQQLGRDFSDMAIHEQNDVKPARDVSSGNSGGASFAAEDSVVRRSLGESVAPQTVNRQYDARLADEAYRAGNAFLAEGDFQNSLKFLYLALSKCPPDKASAVAKIRRVISLAVQQLQKSQGSKHQERS